MIAKHIRLLLIEDNPGDVRLMREMLGEVSGTRFNLEYSDRLETGLKKLAEGGIDLVFLDLGLPDSQGIYTFLKLKSQEQKVPIIVLTGIEDETLGINAVRNGAQDYFVKGQVDGKLLARAIRYAIERKRVEEALRESEEMYKTLVKTSPDAVTVTDLETNIIEVSQQTLDLHGFKRSEELIGRSVLELIAPEEHKKAIKSLQGILKKGFLRNGEYTFLRKDGTRFTGEINASLVKDAYEEPKGFIVSIRDITERRQTDKSIGQLAYYDLLTGLLNRQGFSVLAQQQLKIAHRTKKSVLLIFVHFDELKSINDIFGQHEGDKALIKIAAILKKTFLESDIIARIGGAEFVVLARVAGKLNIANITSHLQKMIEADTKKEKRPYQLSMSVGITLFEPKHPCSIEELMRQASKLEYKLKQGN